MIKSDDESCIVFYKYDFGWNGALLSAYIKADIASGL
jgi:hypothetical protein